jgi:DNA-binding IclR family transcriptional regulator
MNTKAESRQLIGSLTKGLLILEMMMEKDSLGVTEISKVLNVNKSTAYRLLITLEERNFVKQDQITGKYSLGMRLASFRTKVLEGIDIRTIARPYLKKLTDITNESSALCVLSEDHGIVIEKQSSKESISAQLYVGMFEPLHCTALGKVLMSHLPEDRQIELLSKKLEVYTQKTITDKDKLLKDNREILIKGYATDNEEYSLSMRCIAAPVFNSKGEVAAAIGISGPVTRIREDNINEYIAAVKEVAQNVSSNLGYSKLLKK